MILLKRGLGESIVLHFPNDTMYSRVEVHIVRIRDKIDLAICCPKQVGPYRYETWKLIYGEIDGLTEPTPAPDAPAAASRLHSGSPPRVLDGGNLKGFSLSRKVSESITLGWPANIGEAIVVIRVEQVSPSRDRVRLFIHAPPNMPVSRTEILELIEQWAPTPDELDDA